MKKYTILLISLLILLITCSKKSAINIENRFQTAIDIAVDSTKGKGLSAAVILPDGEIWQGVSGLSHPGDKIELNDRFSAGSIGKMFTAVTIIQMCEEEKLSLDDPIFKYLPKYRNIDSTITIKQLLNHTSGLFDFADNSNYWGFIYENSAKIWTLDEMLRTFIREPVYSSGKGWNYATTNYVLLRMLIQKISNKSITEINRARFWNNLNMNYTITSMDSTMPDQFAHGWLNQDEDEDYEDLSSWNRAAFASSIGGEVWTTAGDLAIWINKLLDEKSLVSEEYYTKMINFHSPCPGEDFINGYGLGICKFNPQIVQGVKAWGHAGNALGYGAIGIYLPEYDATIAIMDNTEKAEAIFDGLHNIIDIIKENYSR